MTKEELTIKIDELSKTAFEYIEGGHSIKAKKVIKEWDNCVIELNKLNHCYYEEAEWIYDVFDKIPAREDLIGNDLTNYYAKELNKLNGVLIEKQTFEDNNVNYLINVVTPYSVYSYRLKRGYAGRCKLEKDNLACSSTNKSRAVIRVCKTNICELIYNATFEELCGAEQRSILKKEVTLNA